jgi:hypothetical protein
MFFHNDRGGLVIPAHEHQHEERDDDEGADDAGCDCEPGQEGVAHA